MKKWLLTGCLLAVSVWLYTTGRLELLFLSLAGIFGVGARAASEKYDQAQRETDELLREIRDVLGETEEVRREHDGEVRKIESEDFSGVPIGDLIDGANERERRRTDRTEP
jgi:hypothetical protein